MTSKRYKEVVEQERRRKKGIRRWRSELDRFGSEVIPLIPEDLKDEVIGVRLEDVVTARMPDNFMDKLRRIAPVRQGVNPYHRLEGVLKRRGGH
jgi:hypothetical protein